MADSDFYGTMTKLGVALGIAGVFAAAPVAIAAATRKPEPVEDSSRTLDVVMAGPKRRVGAWLALAALHRDGESAAPWAGLSSVPDPAKDPFALKYSELLRSGQLETGLDARTADVIDRDLARTLPDFEEFRSSAGLDALRRLLRAYALLDKEVSYVQGMNFLAAHSYLAADRAEPDAFALLVAIMGPSEEDLLEKHAQGEGGASPSSSSEGSSLIDEDAPARAGAGAAAGAGAGAGGGWVVVAAQRRFGLRKLYLDTSHGLAVTSHMMVSVIKRFLPRLSKHMEQSEVLPVHYFEPLLTLFSLQLPKATLWKVWTAYFEDGDAALLRTLVCLLSDLEPYILGEAGPELVEVGHPSDDGAADGAAGPEEEASRRVWKERLPPSRPDFSRTVTILKAFSAYMQEDASALASMLSAAEEAAASGRPFAAGLKTTRGSTNPAPERSSSEAAAKGWRRPCGQLRLVAGGRALLRPRPDVAARALRVRLSRADALRLRMDAEEAVRGGYSGLTGARVPDREPDTSASSLLWTLVEQSAVAGSELLRQAQETGAVVVRDIGAGLAV